jgi:hypothetical protein
MDSRLRGNDENAVVVMRLATGGGGCRMDYYF